MRTDYLNSFKKNETEYYDENGQLTTFEKFMDSIELNGSIIFAKRNQVAKLTQALKQYSELAESDDPVYFTDKTASISVNLTELMDSLQYK